MADTGPVLAPSIYSGATPNNVTPAAPAYYGPSSGNNNNGGFSISDIPLNFGGKGSSFADITGKINNFGSSIGFAPGTVTYGSSFGPSLPGAVEAFGPGMAGSTPVAGSLGTSATLSGVAGAAGLGALAGGFLGKIGGNATGGSIGGGAGAAIGMAVGGPPGAIIGGLLGGIGGGFFGGKKPGVVAAEFAGWTSENPGLDRLGYGSKRGDVNQAKSLSYEFNNYLTTTTKQLGLKFKPMEVRGGYNSIYGGSGGTYINIGGKLYSFDGNDAAGKRTAFNDAILDMSTQSGLDTAVIKAFLDKGGGAGMATTPKLAPATVGEPTQFQKFLKDYNASIR